MIAQAAKLHAAKADARRPMRRSSTPRTIRPSAGASTGCGMESSPGSPICRWAIPRSPHSSGRRSCCRFSRPRFGATGSFTPSTTKTPTAKDNPSLPSSSRWFPFFLFLFFSSFFFVCVGLTLRSLHSTIDFGTFFHPRAVAGKNRDPTVFQQQQQQQRWHRFRCADLLRLCSHC